MPNLESYFNYFFLTMKAIYADLKKKTNSLYTEEHLVKSNLPIPLARDKYCSYFGI